MVSKNKTTSTLSFELPQRMDIRVDWAFHYIFSFDQHLVKIIRDLLEKDVEILERLPNGLVVKKEMDKRSVFDVICKDKKTGEVFVFEMQTNYESDMPDRLFYYGGSLLHNQVKRGDTFYKINAVVICCIVREKVPHKGTVPAGKIFFDYKMREAETAEVFNGDKFSICFLELARFENYLDKDSDLKDQWCWLFNNLANFAHRPEYLDPSFDEIIEDSETKRLSSSDQQEYMKALDIDEITRERVFKGGYQIGHMEGKEEGIAIGEAEGKAEDRAELLSLLFASGMPVKEISERTKIPEEEIQAYLKQ